MRCQKQMKSAGLGFFDAVNAAANLKVLDDMTNKTLAKQVDSDPDVPGIQLKGKKRKAGRLYMAVDPELLSQLTPEQRKRLFFAVRGIKPVSVEKRAQSALSAEDAKALMEYVNAQKANAQKAELQRKAMRDKNRAERVRTAKLALMFMLGSAGLYGGAALGNRFGGNGGAALGGILGGIGGGVGGWYLGKHQGNHDADMMEKVEDETGESVSSQATRRAATLAAYNSIMNSAHPGQRAIGSRLFVPYL